MNPGESPCPLPIGGIYTSICQKRRIAANSTPGLRISYRSQRKTGIPIVTSPYPIENANASQSVPEIETFEEGSRLYPSTLIE
jgi:hypothetical protein